jgi:diaminopimelate epimerase
MRFSKWHAFGNSYLLVERADAGRPLEADDARRLCDPGLGVGSDGVLEVVSSDGDRAEVLVWNPDGSTAELSGNGTRIAAAWLAARSGLDAVTIVVGAREVTARVGGDEIETDIGIADVGEIETLALNEEHLEFTPVSVGNPHAVIRGDPAEIGRIGPLVERHGRFPERTNVQLVRVDGLEELTVAVWERGAGETRASGTSAVAAAAVAVASGWCESPVTVHLPGGDLVVRLDAENRATLVGPAVEICRGELV